MLSPAPAEQDRWVRSLTFMAEPFVYDKADWHYGADDFSPDLDESHGFTHTGMFFGWILDHNLYDTDWFGPEMESYVVAFKNRELTGPKFFEACDGVLLDNMLNDEGNAFAHHYFEFGRGKYLADYSELFARNVPSIYHVADTWQNYELLKKRVDKRYREWKRGSSGWWRSFFGKRR
jgi:hypothetical protein